MQNPVSQRFVECYRKLESNDKVRSARQFALKLEIHPQSFHEVLKGRRDVTIELTRKAIELFDFNPQFLFTGKGSLLIDDNDDANKYGDVHMRAVPFISWSVRRSFATSAMDIIRGHPYPEMKLPIRDSAENVLCAFEFRGNHLIPCLMDGDIVITRRLPRPSWTNRLNEGFIYVWRLEEDVLIRRLIDKPNDDQLIVSSGGRDDDHTLLVPTKKVKEIWDIRSKLTMDVPNASNIQYATDRKISNLGELLEQQNATILSLSSTVEKLLKRSRSHRL